MVNCMIDENTKPKVCEDIVWRKEGKGDKVISLASYKGGPIRFLNPVAGKIIKLSDGNHTVKEIINEIYKSFDDANIATVKKDVHKFLQTLLDNKIVIFLD